MSAMRISAITVGARHRRDMGDLAPLAKSIEEIGLLHPIVVDNRGVLIAGERRLQAYKLLGRTEIPVTKVDLAEIARGELDENAIRKDARTGREGGGEGAASSWQGGSRKFREG
jgi:ParB family chromosome partitioning protein